MDSTASFPAGPGITITPASSPPKRERTNSLKKLPGKVGKGIKNQFRRISGNFRNEEDKHSSLPIVVIDPSTLFPSTISHNDHPNESSRGSIFKRKRLSSFSRRSGSFSSSSVSTTCSTCPECIREYRQRQRTVSSPTLANDHHSVMSMPEVVTLVMEKGVESASLHEGERTPLSPPSLPASQSQQTITSPSIVEILPSPAGASPTPTPIVEIPPSPAAPVQPTPVQQPSSPKIETLGVCLLGRILPGMFLPIPNVAGQGYNEENMDSTTSLPAGPGITITPTDSPPRRERTTSLKKLPGKVGKGIKNQFRRISGNFRSEEDKQHHSSLPIVVIDPTTLFPTAVSHNDHPHDSPRGSIFKRKRLSSFGRRSDSFSSSSASTSCSTCPDCVREQRQRQRTVSTPTLAIDHLSVMSMPAPATPVVETDAENPSLLDGERTLLSPPALTQPEVPDPFLHDSDDSGSEGAPAEVELPVESESQQTITVPPASAEISLASPAAVDVSSPLPTPNVDKPVPPPPVQQEASSSESEEETPDVYLPGLILPSMFLPIPNTDPLTTLLTKYIYPPESRPSRDVTGDYKRNDFHTLVMTNSWRALAKMARDRLVSAEPEDLNLVLGLWYIRLACLARLRLFNQTSAECTNLFVVLNAIEPLEARTWIFEKILPFELEVMYARVKYWAGDHMGYLDALTGLLGKCKAKSREGSKKDDETNRAMWKERAARIALIIASELVELKDFAAATKLLLPLCNQGPNVSTAAIRSCIGRIYLQAGEIQAAAYHFDIVGNDPETPEEMKAMNAGLLAVGEGDWETSSRILNDLVEKDAENFVAVNNLSVSLLSQGRLKEGIQVLENALNTSPATVVVEPFLFNLSTLYELRSATAADNKRKLLIEVAKWSGDGLKTTCLKMPTN